jgi:type VI secretion system protein ImpM
MTLDPPGFFGKVPALGDFLDRRIPAALVPAWDQWLGLLTVAVRDAAGDAWPNAWLTAPLWHFALGAAIAPPHGAAGVLVASMDRVGRMFPFTVIGPCAGEPDEAWSAAVETIILGALGDGFDPDSLDAELIKLGAPADVASLPPGQSLWWCGGSDLVPPTRTLIAGLPDRAAAAAMVLGD